MSSIHIDNFSYLHKDFGFVWLRVCPASLGGAFFKINARDQFYPAPILLQAVHPKTLDYEVVACLPPKVFSHPNEKPTEQRMKVVT